MAVPCQYFSKASQMSAVLKKDIARVRANRPELYRARTVSQTKIDGEGKVTTVEVEDLRAAPPSPQYRHRLSWQREWY